LGVLQYTNKPTASGVTMAAGQTNRGIQRIRTAKIFSAPPITKVTRAAINARVRGDIGCKS